jgi:hypothetical protein
MIVEMAHPWALALLPLIPLRFAFRNRRHGGEAIVFSRAPTLAGWGSAARRCWACSPRRCARWRWHLW